AVLFHRRIAASIPWSGESPILGLRAGLGREMRARAEKGESDQMVCRPTIQVQSRPPIGDTLTSARSCLCGVAPCVEAVDATNSGLMRHLSTYFAILALAPVVVGAQASADLVITHAQIYTVDNARPIASALAVRGGRVLF